MKKLLSKIFYPCDYNYIHVVVFSPSCCSMKQLEHCLEAAYRVLLAVEQRLTGTSVNELKSIRSSVALLLYLIAKLDTVQSSQDSSDAKQSSEMKEHNLHVIHGMLNTWLQRRVGPKFGGMYGVMNTGSAEVELKVQCSTHMHTHARTHARTHTHTHIHTHTFMHCTLPHMQCTIHAN